MTREEAKTVFLNRGYVEVEGGTIYDADKWRESCRVISEWLEQETCKDYISRQAVMDCFKKWQPYMATRLHEFEKELLQLPSVAIPSAEPEPGHWTRELIRNEKGGCIGAKMICSKCGNDNKHDEYMNYCPNCGAKMVEKKESEGIE